MALGDPWANPTGTRAPHEAADAVWRLLGVANRRALHERPGMHEQNEADWPVFLDVADKVFGRPAAQGG